MRAKIEEALIAFFVNNYTQGNLQQRVKIWLDVVYDDIKNKKYSEDKVLPAIKRLMRKQTSYPTVNLLISEIEKDNYLDIA